MTDKISDITHFFLQLDALKTVNRRSYINDGSRLENSAEHWFLQQLDHAVDQGWLQE